MLSWGQQETGADRQAAATRQLAAEAALREMRAVFEGTLVLLKGLELSCRYLDPTDRPFGDVDVLTDEPNRLQATLIGLGYEPVAASHDENSHHDSPLQHQRLPIVVEVHRSPGWLAGMTPPRLETLLTMTVPSATGIEGLKALDPPAHAVYLAVHSWRHRPFWRPQDLLDIELLLDDDGVADEAARLAQTWGVSRIWSCYTNTLEARSGYERQNTLVRLFGGAATAPFSRSAISDYLAGKVGQLFVDRPIRMAPELVRWLVRTIRQDLQPRRGERRRDKAKRIFSHFT